MRWDVLVEALSLPLIILGVWRELRWFWRS